MIYYFYFVFNTISILYQNTPVLWNTDDVMYLSMYL